MEFIVAKGGSGGSPANGFLGVKGETKTVDLNLKLIADIGLVGQVLEKELGEFFIIYMYSLKKSSQFSILFTE